MTITSVLCPTQNQEKMIKNFLEATEIFFFEEKVSLPPYVIVGI